MPVADSILIRILKMRASLALIADTVGIFVCSFTAVTYIAADITYSVLVCIFIGADRHAFSVLAANCRLRTGGFPAARLISSWISSAMLSCHSNWHTR